MVRFTRKKIDSLTLGERMKKIRNDRRLSLAEISKSTKIQCKYLEYLEESQYAKLPADVYVKGFLRSYAVHMGLNEQSLIKQYEREKGIHKNIKKISDDDGAHGPINFSTVVITPKMIIVSAILFLSATSFFYLYREVNNFVSTPRLVIMKPSEGMTVSANSTHVAGIAEKDALVFINDQPVLVSENGEFSEDVSLKPGLNMITVKVRSRFNKEAVKSVSVNADFQTTNADQSAQTTGGETQNQPDSAVSNTMPISAEVYVDPASTWISIEADGNLVYSGVLLPQSVQTFTAQKVISITSGKGDGTFVKINGKDMGVLSKDPGVVRDMQYDANGKINIK